MREDGPVCLSVAISATPKGRPVVTADLESLPGLDRKALDAFRALGTAVLDDEAWRAGRNLGRTYEIFHPDPREVSAALRTRSDVELERVAEVYRANVSTRPVEAVEALGYSRRTADRRIRAARERGFLPPTTRGKRKA
jgi:hypothetical protein